MPRSREAGRVIVPSEAMAVSPYVTEVREERCEGRSTAKALSPIFVTDDGMVTEVRERQSKKAFLPISVTESGMVTEVSEEQRKKAPLPIFVPPKMSIEVREVQSQKA